MVESVGGFLRATVRSFYTSFRSVPFFVLTNCVVLCAVSNIPARTQIFPASTDGRFLRTTGIPVFGFSPMNNTPILLHDHNERLHRDVFLRGIDLYRRIIPDLCAADPADVAPSTA